MINLQEKQRELASKRAELEQRIENIKGAPESQRVAFKNGELPRRQHEIKMLFDDLQSDADMLSYQERNRAELKSALAPHRSGLFAATTGGNAFDARSLGQRFVDSDAYNGRGGDTKVRPIEAKFDGMNVKSWQDGAYDSSAAIKTTAFSTTAGFAPFIPRSDRVVPLGQIQPVIADLIPQETTSVPGGKYMVEEVYTNNAAIVPEGSTKPEAALRFREQLFSMAKIAVTLPVTDEQLSDVPQVRGIIDNRLALMVRQKEDGYLLNNTAINGFDGFLQKTGVQTRAMGTDPLPTAVLDLMTSIEYEPGFASVTGLIMNPKDWQGYVSYQLSTGAYLVGSPSDAAITTMWGMPIIRTNRMPQGKALLGDFRSYSEILRREELSIRVGYINTDFVDNIQRILAEERVSLEIFRASAFGIVTGISF
ncbi:phage major capsid protein [bacterium]|nr:MAG: phage major capsid protein [bacterium]